MISKELNSIGRFHVSTHSSGNYQLWRAMWDLDIDSSLLSVVRNQFNLVELH